MSQCSLGSAHTNVHTHAPSWPFLVLQCDGIKEGRPTPSSPWIRSHQWASCFCAPVSQVRRSVPAVAVGSRSGDGGGTHYRCLGNQPDVVVEGRGRLDEMGDTLTGSPASNPRDGVRFISRVLDGTLPMVNEQRALIRGTTSAEVLQQGRDRPKDLPSNPEPGERIASALWVKPVGRAEKRYHGGSRERAPACRSLGIPDPGRGEELAGRR